MIIGGMFDSVTVASVELVVMKACTQLVVSTSEFGSGSLFCALTGAGVSQPEKSRPMVMVAMTINTRSIGLRLAIFNIFSLMFLFWFQTFYPQIPRICAEKTVSEKSAFIGVICGLFIFVFKVQFDCDWGLVELVPPVCDSRGHGDGKSLCRDKRSRVEIMTGRHSGRMAARNTMMRETGLTLRKEMAAAPLHIGDARLATRDLRREICDSYLN